MDCERELRSPKIDISVKYFELVADSPNGFKYPLVRDTLELFTQTLYVNVNGSRVDLDKK